MKLRIGVLRNLVPDGAWLTTKKVFGACFGKDGQYRDLMNGSLLTKKIFYYSHFDGPLNENGYWLHGI